MIQYLQSESVGQSRLNTNIYTDSRLPLVALIIGLSVLTQERGNPLTLPQSVRLDMRGLSQRAIMHLDISSSFIHDINSLTPEM